jgi:anti-sigma regulatory factor (Ser/Thr protein kinase)
MRRLARLCQATAFPHSNEGFALAVSRRSLALPGDARSPGIARRFVAETLAAWGLEAHASTVVLAVSELAGNAVRHGKPPYTLGVARTDEAVVVTLSDAGAGGIPAVLDHRSDAHAEAGRGLGMVASVTDAWGWQRHVDGVERTEVWFRVDIASAARA